MNLDGSMLIGDGLRRGAEQAFRGRDAASGSPLEPAYGGATVQDVADACTLAAAAFPIYRAIGPEERARFLERIADNITALGATLFERAVAESGLPRARIEGECARTTGQLRLFATEVRDGGWQGVRIDLALPERKPLPRPDLRLRHIALGPVAVFGASNFPLAFSVAGGDTASALAAGCPVVVKAHPAHPGTSELVGRAIQMAVVDSGLPAGTFSLLFGIGDGLGRALVSDPRIKAVGFTGSRSGGLALAGLAAARKEPIPFYAEMSSVNPVLLLPGALSANAAALGKAFAGSLTLGTGQFCTNPGLVFAIPGAGLDTFIASAAEVLGNTPAGVMLHEGIAAAYARGVSQLDEASGVAPLACGPKSEGRAHAVLFTTDANNFKHDPNLSEEIFGPAALVVRCPDEAALLERVAALDGQLTITLQMTEEDNALAARILPIAEEKAGRILVNGWPTGVEVCHAMVHGGPFPATSDSRTTSVGSLAIARFLRPVCYQNMPRVLLPTGLDDRNSLGLWRRIDGVMTQDAI